MGGSAPVPSLAISGSAGGSAFSFIATDAEPVPATTDPAVGGGGFEFITSEIASAPSATATGGDFDFVNSGGSAPTDAVPTAGGGSGDSIYAATSATTTSAVAADGGVSAAVAAEAKFKEYQARNANVAAEAAKPVAAANVFGDTLPPSAHTAATATATVGPDLFAGMQMAGGLPSAGGTSAPVPAAPVSAGFSFQGGVAGGALSTEPAKPLQAAPVPPPATTAGALREPTGAFPYNP